MARQQRIRYLIDTSTWQVVSRVGDEFAWPILDFAGMTPENNFRTRYDLQKVSMQDAYPGLPLCRRTRLIPLGIKNTHRIFWGMKPLKKLNKWEEKILKERTNVG